MKICGIDPGVNGALATIENGALVSVRDIPVETITKTDGRVRRKVDPETLLMILRELAPDLVVLEHVHASPGMGVSSAFTFGQLFGTIESVVRIAGMELQLAHSSVWKRGMNVPADKKATVAEATRLFGGDQFWPRAKDHNRAEAALIALFGHRLQQQREARSAA